MADFTLEQFVENPAEGLRMGEDFRKTTWVQIADQYGVRMPRSRRKSDIRSAVMDYLREKGILDAYEAPDRDEETLAVQEEARRDETGQAERVGAKEAQTGAAVQRKRQAEHELELTRLRGHRRDEGNDNGDSFMHKAKNLIPKFSEDPDNFLSGFEEVAEMMGWDKEKWHLLVQSAVTGKALSVALALGTESRKDYHKLKNEVLKAYQITPEYYRVEF